MLPRLQAQSPARFCFAVGRGLPLRHVMPRLPALGRGRPVIERLLYLPAHHTTITAAGQRRRIAPHPALPARIFAQIYAFRPEDSPDQVIPGRRRRADTVLKKVLVAPGRHGRPPVPARSYARRGCPCVPVGTRVNAKWVQTDVVARQPRFRSRIEAVSNGNLEIRTWKF